MKTLLTRRTGRFPEWMPILMGGLGGTANGAQLYILGAGGVSHLPSAATVIVFGAVHGALLACLVVLALRLSRGRRWLTLPVWAVSGWVAAAISSVPPAVVCAKNPFGAGLVWLLNSTDIGAMVLGVLQVFLLFVDGVFIVGRIAMAKPDLGADQPSLHVFPFLGCEAGHGPWTLIAPLAMVLVLVSCWARISMDRGDRDSAIFGVLAGILGCAGFCLFLGLLAGFVSVVHGASWALLVGCGIEGARRGARKTSREGSRDLVPALRGPGIVLNGLGTPMAPLRDRRANHHLGASLFCAKER